MNLVSGNEIAGPDELQVEAGDELYLLPTLFINKEQAETGAFSKTVAVSDKRTKSGIRLAWPPARFSGTATCIAVFRNDAYVGSAAL